MIKKIIQKVHNAERISPREARQLFDVQDLTLLGQLADEIRRRKTDPTCVTYNIDRNINYTNICVTDCSFCAFYRRPGSPEGYVLPFEQMGEKIEELISVGGTQILLQGGHNPHLKIDFYESMLQYIKKNYPTLWIHGFSGAEIYFISQVFKMSLHETLERLIRAGLDSIPGGGAEVLTKSARDKIAPKKADAHAWLDVMRHAHQLGLRSTATMMFGHVETLDERINHLLMLRDLQDETRGFTAFISWTFQPENTPIGGSKTSPFDYLRTLAISRIFLDNFDHFQASWVTQGPKIGQISLKFGVDDFGSVMMEENVVSAAGTHYMLDEKRIVHQIEKAGFVAKRRNMHYKIIGEPFFRSIDCENTSKKEVVNS